MREILGRRRRLRFRRKRREERAERETQVVAQLDAALLCATEWDWPVLPGVGLRAARPRGVGARALLGAPAAVACACPDPQCVVPGAHPFDPGLLAATTDARMIRWWWSGRPDAPVLLATGGRAPCAVSLPAVAGARALAALDALGMRLGPVVASPTRWAILVAPYSLERLGELLYTKDSVPSSLRFHGEGGYLPLPPSTTGTGQVRWERAPLAGSARPWLPDVEAVVDALVEASTSLPGGGSKLAY
ncbi:bifunctional DNA primase/polymerase [Streptomyces sp. NPDC057411]|uniref:bifunctional DNA primase/polymerase n=1 Tax=unclassified Streptomyces TaxID=2593676 RepID=UPI00362C0FA5